MLGKVLCRGGEKKFLREKIAGGRRTVGDKGEDFGD